MFLKLVIAGHSPLYVTRTNGWFWQRPWPSPLLFGATFVTEIVGTVIAVLGVFITPISWKYALFIWGYAFVWFIFNDIVKQFTYKFVRRHPLPAHIRK